MDFFCLWVLLIRQIFGPYFLNIQFYIPRDLLCVTKKTVLKTIPLIRTYRQEAYAYTWNSVEPWSKMVLRVVCVF